MRLLSASEVERLIDGSSLFGTGGGLSRAYQRGIFSGLHESGAKLGLLEAAELEPRSAICCVYGVGAAGREPRSWTRALKAGANQVQSMLGRTLSAIFPAEVNIEALVFSAAANLGIPVLDADVSGGRAVPEARFDNFFLHDLAVTPAVVCELNGRISVIEGICSGNDLEASLRSFVCRSPEGAVIVFDHIGCLGDLKHALTVGAIRRSLAVGQLLQEWRLEAGREIAPYVERLASAASLGNCWVAGARISALSISEQSGFLVGQCSLRGARGEEMVVYLKNENLALVVDGDVKVTCPDLIVLLDEERLVGLHNSELKPGMNVLVLAMPCEPRWESKEGRSLFSPRGSGLALEPRLLRRAGLRLEPASSW